MLQTREHVLQLLRKHGPLSTAMIKTAFKKEFGVEKANTTANAKAKKKQKSKCPLSFIREEYGTKQFPADCYLRGFMDWLWHRGDVDYGMCQAESFASCSSQQLWRKSNLRWSITSVPRHVRHQSAQPPSDLARWYFHAYGPGTWRVLAV